MKKHHYLNRISLTTNVDPQAPPCLITNLQPIEINTGGRIGTFEGKADNLELNNL